MPIVRRLQTNMNRGELSPYIEGRPDLALYFSGAKTLENFLILPEGGVFRRSGTLMIKEVKDSSAAIRVIPFKFNIAQTYAIEAGNLYFRFYRRNPATNAFERIESGGSPVEVVTPYTSADLAELQWAQSADVLYLAHPDYQQRKLTRVTDTSWTFSLFSPDPPPSFQADTDLAVVGAPSANTGTGLTFRAGGSPFLAGDAGRQLLTVAGRAVVTAYVSADEVTIDVLEDLGATIAAGPNTISTVGAAGTSTAHGLSVNDFVVLTSGAQAGEIRRVSAVGGVDTFTLDAAFSVNQAGETWNKVSPLAASTWFLQGSPQQTLDPDIKEPVKAQINLTAGGNAFRSTDLGKYIKIYGGLIKITTVTSATAIKGQILSVLSDATQANPAAAPAGSWTLEVASWSAARGWPSSVDFHQGRLWFGGTDAQKTTVWGSASNDYENYAVGSLADNAVEYTMASRAVNVVEWLKSLAHLFIGDAENEHLMKGPGVDEPIGGDVVPLVTDPSSVGSMSTMAQVVGDVLLFVQAYAKRVFRIAYDLTRDAFTPVDLLFPSRHIGADSMFAQHPPVYQKEPNSIVYFTRQDGQMPALTYYRNEEVSGWSRWKTAGSIESVCSIPNRVDGADDLVLACMRTINGATKRFVELVNEKDLVIVSRAWRQTFTDCGITGTIAGAPTATIAGLGHLEGEDVDVVTNLASAAPQAGSYKGRYTVAGGQITLPEALAVGTEYEVGLPYTATLVTMRPSIIGHMMEGVKRHWVKVFLRVYKSVGAIVNDKEVLFDVGGQAMDQGPQPYTGDKEVFPGEGSDLDGYITVRQPRPVPLTVLGVFGTVEFGDTM